MSRKSLRHAAGGDRGSAGESEVAEVRDSGGGPVDAVARRRQSGRIFQVFMTAKVCSTRARTLRWAVLSPSFQPARWVWPARDQHPSALVATVGQDGGASGG